MNYLANSFQNVKSTVTPFIKKKDNLELIKRGVWVYFLLLLFEGALRKWFLPALATPLLIVRDPVAIWLIYYSWKDNIFPTTIYLKGMVFIGIVAIYTAIFIGHGNLYVALFGARIYLLHFPLMFVIGQVFTREDIIKMGKATLYIAVPMVILTYLQFKSPQSAWVNRGVGGNMEGAGFAGSGEFLRPPATFSFTNGTALFFGWLAPFVFYFWFNVKEISKWWLVGATIAMIFSIPISISRTLLFQVSITLAFTMFAVFRRPDYLGKLVMSILIAIVFFIIMSQTPYFKVATGAFSSRFNEANEQEGGLVKGVLVDRFLGGLGSALFNSKDQPFFGQGLGIGTNAGSQLLTGKEVFLISETPWGQIIGELGPLMGVIIICLRIGLIFKLTRASYKKMILGDFLPWLLLSFAFLSVLQGGLSQPTSLGFIVMGGGLVIASLKNVSMQTVGPVNQTLT